MIAEMPVPNGENHFVQVRSVVLGVALDLYYRWSTRQELWTLDIDVDDVPLVTGQVLRPGKDLLARADAKVKPAVVMFVVWPDDVEDLTTPGLTDFDGRAMLVVYDGS